LLCLCKYHIGMEIFTDRTIAERPGIGIRNS
jgi:hypothetical protein